MTVGLHTVTVTPPGGAAVDISCFIDQVSIHHGRDDTDSQPDASSCTLEISTNTSTDDLPLAIDVGSVVLVTTTLGGAPITRFTGSITDLSQGWDDAGEWSPDLALAQVIATGILADLGRRVVGDNPWPQQLDGAREAAIMAAAGITLDPLYSDPGQVQVLARDVDSQPALDLAQAVAQDAGGLLWSTRAGLVRYADALHRRNLVPSLELDACDVLISPTWRRTTEGLINQVSIGYGVAPEGSDQPRYVDQAANSITRYGTYGLSATTQLAAAADAQAMGQLLLARNSTPVWVLAALPVAVEDLTSADTSTLLGMEVGDLLSLTGLPSAGGVPTSAALWVEGWTETLAWGIMS